MSNPILGQAERFAQLFEAVLNYSESVPLTMVIDEFRKLDMKLPAFFAKNPELRSRLFGVKGLSLADM